MQVRTPSGMVAAPSARSVPSGANPFRHLAPAVGAGLLAFLFAAPAVFLLSVNLDHGFAQAWQDALVAAVAAAIVFMVVHLVERVRRSGKDGGGPGPEGWTISAWLGLLFLFLLAQVAWAGIDWLRADAPASSSGEPMLKAARYSYGPDDAREVELTLAPGVSAELLPSAESLGGRRFEQFDLTAAGAVLVLDEGRLFDMLSGEDLLGASAEVRAFAMAGGALAVVTDQGGLGYDDGSSFRRVADAPYPQTGLAPSTDRSTLFLYRESDDGGAAGAAVLALPSSAKPEYVAESPRAIRAVGGDVGAAYYADGSRLYRAGPDGPELLLTVPDGQPIFGIATAGRGIYFATQRAVFALDGAVALPLVLGIGGPLRLHGPDLYVLARRHGRVFRLDLPKKG